MNVVQSKVMSAPKNKKICQKEMNSIESAVKDSGIVAIHPEKMEDYAEYLVRKLKENHN